MQDDQTLNICALGEYQPEYLKEITQLFAQHACEITYSRIITHRNITQLHFLISARWSVLAKLDTKLKALSQKFSYEILLKHTQLSPLENKTDTQLFLPYSLYVYGLLNTEGLSQLIRFLYSKNVRVTEISVDTQRSYKNPTRTTTFHIKIELSSETAIAQWRENFMLFCDDLNLDAVMEPNKD